MSPPTIRAIPSSMRSLFGLPVLASESPVPPGPGVYGDVVGTAGVVEVVDVGGGGGVVLWCVGGGVTVLVGVTGGDVVTGGGVDVVGGAGVVDVGGAGVVDVGGGGGDVVFVGQAEVSTSSFVTVSVDWPFGKRCPLSAVKVTETFVPFQTG